MFDRGNETGSPYWAGTLAMALAVVLFLLGGCTAFAPKPPPVAPVPEQKAKATTGKYSVDAPLLIQELSESGCELTSLSYEEGRQKALFTAKCRETGLPQ